MSFSASSPGRLPLRVHIRTPKIVIRPTVGILVDLHMTMAQIMDTAFAFQDRFKKSEAEIIDVLSAEVVVSEFQEATLCLVSELKSADERKATYNQVRPLGHPRAAAP